VQARLHRPDGNTEHLRDFIDGKVFKKIKCDGFALRERELIQRVMNLLGIVEGNERATAFDVFNPSIGFIRHPAKAQATDRDMARGGVKKRRQASRISQGTDCAEYFQPGFLEKVPRIGLGGREAAQIIKQRPFPQSHDAVECRGITSLASCDEEF